MFMIESTEYLPLQNLVVYQLIINMSQDLLRVSVDIVIFKIIENQLCVLVVKRATAPFIGQRCLP